MRIAVLIVGFIFFLAMTVVKPKSAVYYYNKAETEREKHDFKSAYRNYSKALEINPNYYEAVFKRALLKVDMDSINSAITDFTRALTIKQTSEAYGQRGNAKWTLKDSTGACEDWQSACDLYYTPSCEKKRENCKR